jgi:hypothetical protein
LPELNSNSQAKRGVLATERQILVKEGDELRVVCQTAVDENAKKKSDNQAHLEERQRLISMNTKLIADQRTCQNSSRYWQSDADKLRGKVNRMVYENERLCPVTQQLVEAHALLAVDRQNLPGGEEQLDWAIAWLDRYGDALESLNQKRIDQGSAVHSLLGQPSRSRKVKEGHATQFSLTICQQNR